MFVDLGNSKMSLLTDRKTNQKKIFLTIVAFIMAFSFACLIDAPHSYECQCVFDGKSITSIGENLTACLEQCGKVVGGQTKCDNECDSCCKDWCSKLAEKESKSYCDSPCRKSCDFKKFMGDFTSIFYILSGIVAVVVVVIHGLRFVSADDAKKRAVAKKSIMYIIIALIIIGIGGAVINMLMKGLVTL